MTTPNPCKGDNPWAPDRHTSDLAYLSRGCVHCSRYCSDYHKYVSEPWYFKAAMEDGRERRKELVKDLSILLKDLVFILKEMPLVALGAKRKKK